MTQIDNSVTDIIGDEYKEWKGGDVVFISSPTGSGKTYFVLNVFLDYLAQNRLKLLYLVNRKILKEQLDEELNNLPINLSNSITIELYQTVEKELLNHKNFSVLEMKYDKYDCAVCDECHYFLADSNYNTNTILSYKFINYVFRNKKQVYMSATIKDIKKVIRDDMENEKYIQSFWMGYHRNDVERFGLLKNRKIYEYNLKRNYQYLEIAILKSRDEIKDLVVNGKEKWLIFVDSKLFGKTLAKDILEGFKSASKEEYVKFITSDYDLDEETAEIVETIVTQGKQAPKVLIATSVLDNGINIKDIELRHIILVADTETEFIQMLGRKRNDGHPIKLYIYKHDKNHFMRRKRVAGQRQRIAAEYYKAICEQIERSNIDTKGINIKNMLDQLESSAIWHQHQVWLKKIMNSEVSFENLRTVFLAYNGYLILNMLSMKNIENLNQYYTKLLIEFDKDGEDVFVRKQLSWLGKSEEEIDEILENSKKSSYELSREKVIQEFERVCDVKMSRQEFKDFKNKIMGHLEVLVECTAKDEEKYNTFYEICTKTDRTITKEFMDCLKVHCNIPFAVERGKYTITRSTE